MLTIYNVYSNFQSNRILTHDANTTAIMICKLLLCLFNYLKQDLEPLSKNPLTIDHPFIMRYSTGARNPLHTSTRAYHVELVAKTSYTYEIRTIKQSNVLI